MSVPSFDIVVPTTRPSSLARLLQALGTSEGPLPGEIIVVDDRANGSPAPLRVPERIAERVCVVPGAAAGPASARNIGWRAAHAEWIAYLDDDVIPARDWLARLADDLRALGPHVAACQGRVRVPLPAHRRPTDWERSVSGLESARWATADIAFRRSALMRIGGFDVRFPRAFREDADVALRLLDAGYTLVVGTRRVVHPVGPAGFWESVRRERGNADDALMRALHGRGWHRRAGASVARRPVHMAVTAAGVSALAALALGRRRVALAGAVAWLAGGGELVWARAARGPRTRAELATVVATSAVIPAAATYHWLAGIVRARRLVAARALPAAVLLDRDGTLVADVPYNGDPEQVVPVAGARRALDRLRSAGVPTAVVSNQSGVGRGLITAEQVEAVNRRIEELLGPLGPWAVCTHVPEDSCTCRKPSPGLVLAAARELGVPPERCAVIGDIGADVEAATAAGARAVLVPGPNTRADEVAAAPEVARDLEAAVELLLGGAR